MGDGGVDPGAFIGSQISCISKNDVRYEGILFAIDMATSELTLQNARSFGSEHRRAEPIPPGTDTIAFLRMKGSDIKEISVVCSPAPGMQQPDLAASTTQAPQAPIAQPPPAPQMPPQYSMYTPQVPQQNPWGPPTNYGDSAYVQNPWGPVPNASAQPVPPTAANSLWGPPSVPAQPPPRLAPAPFPNAPLPPAAPVPTPPPATGPPAGSAAYQPSGASAALPTSLMPPPKPVAPAPVPTAPIAPPPAMPAPTMTVTQESSQPPQQQQQQRPQPRAWGPPAVAASTTTRAPPGISPAPRNAPGLAPPPSRPVHPMANGGPPLQDGHHAPPRPNSYLGAAGGVSRAHHDAAMALRGRGRAAHPPAQRGGRTAHPPPAAGRGGPAHPPRPAAPPVPDEDFDFESANKKLDKEEIAKTLAPKLKAHDEVYEKDDFFDSMSCEALERMHISGGGIEDHQDDWRKRAADQRRIDMETFGYVRNFHGGRGRGRGRGGRGGPQHGRGGGGRGRGRYSRSDGHPQHL